MAPHAIDDDARRRSSSSRVRPFPMADFSNSQGYAGDVIEDGDAEPFDTSASNGYLNGTVSSLGWSGQKTFSQKAWNIFANGSSPKTRHNRQKSLSEAIRTVRTRKASISENAHEIAESLKAPVSFRVVSGCIIWYATSILTNTSSKAILTAFNKPVTLTVIQFLLVLVWCLALSWAAKHSPALREFAPVLKNGIRKPSSDIIYATLPLTAFQVGGHILNSDAMARIPVSLVHTIKGLSPLMTVVAYRVFYDIKYPFRIYMSLVPLTLGVFMACAASSTSDFVGLSYALGSAILFVTQNIVSKKIFNEAAKAEADGTPVGRRKPDKLNLLCYSSGMAFLVTAPIWVFSEGIGLLRDYMSDGSITLREKPGALDHGPLLLEFLFNGTFHFGQSLVAFILLGMVSPVTYSVASLIKRVAVIMFAIAWFGSPMSLIQGYGFALTFLGLYLYDRASHADKADKQAKEIGEVAQPLLPLEVNGLRKGEPSMTQSPMSADSPARGHYLNGDISGSARTRGSDHNSPAHGTTKGGVLPLPAGTKAEETWRLDNSPDGTVR